MPCWTWDQIPTNPWSCSYISCVRCVNCKLFWGLPVKDIEEMSLTCLNITTKMSWFLLSLKSTLLKHVRPRKIVPLLGRPFWPVSYRRPLDITVVAWKKLLNSKMVVLFVSLTAARSTTSFRNVRLIRRLCLLRGTSCRKDLPGLFWETPTMMLWLLTFVVQLKSCGFSTTPLKGFCCLMVAWWFLPGISSDNNREESLNLILFLYLEELWLLRVACKVATPLIAWLFLLGMSSDN